MNLIEKELLTGFKKRVLSGLSDGKKSKKIMNTLTTTEEMALLDAVELNLRRLLDQQKNKMGHRLQFIYDSQISWDKIQEIRDILKQF